MDGKLRNMTSVYLYDNDGLLCLYRVGSRVVNHKYVGSAGGHFEPEELSDARACVLRELEEELGLKAEDVPDMKLRYITCRYKSGELRNNYYFFAPFSRDRVLHSNEGTLHWLSWKEAEDIPMPASARHMMDHYLSVGRFDSKFYGGMAQAGGTRFVALEEFED